MSFPAKHPLLLFVAMSLSLVSCTVLPAQVSSSPTPPPPPPDSTEGAPVPTLDPASIPGAIPVSLRTDGTSPVDAQWVYLNGAEEYNSQLDDGLLGILDQNAGGRYDPLIPDPAAQVFDNGLKLDQEIIAAGGTMVGTRMTRSQMVDGTATSVSVTTEYTDLSTGAVQTGSALATPHGVEAVRKLLGDAIELETKSTASPASTETANTAEASSGTASVPPTVEALLNGAAFGSNGALVVPVIADPYTGSPLTDPVAVHIKAEASAPLLSDLGQQVQQLFETGSELTPLTPAAAGQEHVNCDLVPCAALTYDDGPNEQTTRLLGILAAHNVHATFFQQGIYVATHPEISAAVADAGHVIANHTMHHPYLTKLSAAGASAEIQGTSAAIINATGATPGFLRPPYGASNAMVNSLAGMPLVDWSVDSLDWQSRDKAVFIPKILNLVKPGAVILQHDIHPTTVDGQEELITTLQGLGYHLVTVPQLFRGIEMQNGQAYFCRGKEYPCTPGR